MKIAIIGAGAAGCFAAANIPSGIDREVFVFEKTGKALQKVKVSGGGRCNTTHNLFDVSSLMGKYPRGKNFLRKTLHEFSPQQTIEWFSTRGVALKAEADGRMFPVTDSSQTIIDCIWQEMMKARVTVRYHKAVEILQPLNDGFRIWFADKSSFNADKVLIACGGFPKSEQFKWIEALGHTIEQPVPSLFTFNLPGHSITELMGVSVPNVTVKIADTKIQESGPILITHWGLSGPAVLRASAWGARELNSRDYRFNVFINWLGSVTETELKAWIQTMRNEYGKQQIAGKSGFDLPRRLWQYLLLQCGISETVRWGEISAASQNKLIEILLRHRFIIVGKTTFKEEFVTCGGVSLSEVNAKTMESRLLPGIYFAGEILNADGITGGFNFQHAWASGYIAARSIVGNKTLGEQGNFV